MSKPRYGLYQVTGRRCYRDHRPGAVFEARLDKGAERRAIVRGDIRLLSYLNPSITPGSFTFPEGWLTADQLNT